MRKAAVLKKYKTAFEIENIAIPEIGEAEVLVRVRASGLCASDLHIQDGQIPTVKLPFIPGHELAGEVEKVGLEVTGFSQGDHVIAAIDVTCGKCRFCISGRGNLCAFLKRIGFERDGAHSEYAVVPAPNLVKIQSHVAWEQAAIIPDAVSCMLHCIKVQGKVGVGDRIIILGIGGLGMQGVQIAKLAGAEVFCTSRRGEKVKIAEKMGADVGINTSQKNICEETDELTSGEGFDVVFDNIGTKESIHDGLKICRRGGKIIIVGYTEQNVPIDLYTLMIQEKEIIGARGSTKRDLIEAVRLVEQGKIKPYVSDTFPLDEINVGLKKLREGKIIGRGVLMI